MKPGDIIERIDKSYTSTSDGTVSIEIGQKVQIHSIEGNCDHSLRLIGYNGLFFKSRFKVVTIVETYPLY